MQLNPWTATLVLSLAVSGCGGGGDEPVAALPPPVTQSVDAAGATITAALARGAQVELIIPPGALAQPEAVTLTPVDPGADEWTRFRLSPGTAGYRTPVRIAVRPPADLDRSTLPVLELLTGNGPMQLRTSRAPDGSLQATLPALALGASPAATRARAAASNRAAGEPPADGGPTDVRGVGFVASCAVAKSVIDSAGQILDSATTVDRILNVVATLATVHDNCGQADVQQRLADFAIEAAARHAAALAEWQARDYADVDANFASFGPGVRRVMAWCNVATLLGSSLVCPITAELEQEYLELRDGFRLSAARTDDTSALQVLFAQVLPLPGEAEALGASTAQAGLVALRRDLADVLIERAYAVCNHGDLFNLMRYVEAGGDSTFAGQTLREDIAYCGSSVLAAAHNDDGPIAGSERTLLPGDAAGNRPQRAQTVPTPFADGVLLTLLIPKMACSKVIGVASANDRIVLRSGSLELDRLSRADLDRTDLPFHFLGGVSNLLSRLGRPADSTDPIRIEIHREAMTITGCSDEFGQPIGFAVPDQLLYTLTITPIPALPTRWVGTVSFTISRHFDSTFVQDPPRDTGLVSQRHVRDTTLETTWDVDLDTASNAMLIAPRLATGGILQTNTTVRRVFHPGTGINTPDCIVVERGSTLIDLPVSPLEDQGIRPRTLALALDSDGSYGLSASVGQVAYRGTNSGTLTVTAVDAGYCSDAFNSSTFNDGGTLLDSELFTDLLPGVRGTINGGLIQGSNTVTIPVPPSTSAGTTDSGASTATMTWSLRPR